MEEGIRALAPLSIRSLGKAHWTEWPHKNADWPTLGTWVEWHRQTKAGFCCSSWISSQVLCHVNSELMAHSLAKPSRLNHNFIRYRFQQQTTAESTGWDWANHSSLDPAGTLTNQRSMVAKGIAYGAECLGTISGSAISNVVILHELHCLFLLQFLQL